MYTDEEISDQTNLVLAKELAVHRAKERLDAAPWVSARKQDLKDARDSLRHHKRVLEQMWATRRVRLF